MCKESKPLAEYYADARLKSKAILYLKVDRARGGDYNE